MPGVNDEIERNAGTPARVLAFGLALGLGASATLVPRMAHAQESAPALFAEGQRLMSQGKAAEACPKFERSLALTAGTGTKFNLADCYEKTGRFATALTMFREVEEATRKSGQAERSTVAKKRGDALEPRVPTVIVHAQWWATLPRASIALDGRQLSPGELDKPIRVDSGSHEAIARLDSSETKAQVVIEKEGESKTLAPEAPKVAAPLVTTPPVTQGTEAPREGDSTGGTQRAIGLVVGGLGVVALGVGAVVVLSAKSSYSDATSTCGTACPPDETTKANDARDSANLGGIVLGAGLAALVTGTIVFFTAPRSAKAPSAATASDVRRPTIRFSPLGVSATGTF